MPAFGEHLRAFYPGLIPIEATLWRVWLRENEQDFDGFVYNVHVGAGVAAEASALDQLPDVRANVERAWRLGTQRKIDAVGRRGAETWVFEIEERPGARALGQLMLYETLLPESFTVAGPIVLAVIARRVSPDVLRALASAGARVWEVSLHTADAPRRAL